MKLSNNWLIIVLNAFSTLLLLVAIGFLIHLIVTEYFPFERNGQRTFKVSSLVTEKPRKMQTPLTKMKIIVQESKVVDISVDLTENYNSRSLLPLFFQILKIISEIFGIITLYLFNLFLRSLYKDEIFTRKNANLLISIGLILIFMPVLSWYSQQILLWGIDSLKLNHSGYILNNNEKLFEGESVVGLIILVIGFVFRVGVNIKLENESFV